jgi:hypothetical protein
VQRFDSDDDTTYEFAINVDHTYLNQERKRIGSDAKVARAQFVFGTVLVGLGLIHRYQQLEKSHASDDQAEGEESPVSHILGMTGEDWVGEVTRAVAPFLVPMISQLSTLTDSQVDSLAAVGDEE